jgi:hypothetical protein
MSDYEDEYMCNEDEDYDLEYSEDSNSEPDVDLENQVHLTIFFLASTFQLKFYPKRFCLKVKKYKMQPRGK